jgi:hypothetical protein
LREKLKAGAKLEDFAVHKTGNASPRKNDCLISYNVDQTVQAKQVRLQPAVAQLPSPSSLQIAEIDARLDRIERRRKVGDPAR